MDGLPYNLHPQPPKGEIQAQQACIDNPMLPQCQKGIYSYVLNNNADTAFLICYIIVIITLVSIASVKRQAFFYSTAMWVGLTFEALGYTARRWSANNQLQTDPFYMQIVCLTVGPAFMAAAIYFCMRHMVVSFGGPGPLHSPLSPEGYTRVFIPCDIVSLILQATGGALAAKAHKAHDQLTLNAGTNIMIAGLSFQVFTMAVFGFLGLVFLWRISAAHQIRRRDGLPLNPLIVSLSQSVLLKAFVWSIIGSTLLIFARCCYRVAKLSGGWSGSLMQNQTLFIVCEGVFILVASILLTGAHPAIAAPKVLLAGGRFDSTHMNVPMVRWRRQGADTEAGQVPTSAEHGTKSGTGPMNVNLVPTQSA